MLETGCRDLLPFSPRHICEVGHWCCLIRPGFYHNTDWLQCFKIVVWKKVTTLPTVHLVSWQLCSGSSWITGTGKYNISNLDLKSWNGYHDSLWGLIYSAQLCVVWFSKFSHGQHHPTSYKVLDGANVSGVCSSGANGGKYFPHEHQTSRGFLGWHKGSIPNHNNPQSHYDSVWWYCAH